MPGWGRLDPVLEILRAKFVLNKNLASIIGNTKGHLTKIIINTSGGENKRLIQLIYKRLNIKYFRSTFKNSGISDWEKY